MITDVGGLTGSTLYSLPVDGEVRAPRQTDFTSGELLADAPGFELAGRLPVQGSVGGQKEQILEIVVAAVTVVADIVTLALSRLHQRDRGTTASSSTAPRVRPPTPLGHGPSPSQIPLTIPSPVMMPAKRLEAIRSDAGDITVRTYDGYLVRADAVEGGWSITSPDGKTTRVTGGSQVRESDGGTWAVTGRSSFLFGAHKLTVDSSPRKNGAPRASSMTLYSGKERVTIGGLNTERPFLEAAAGDGTYHDDATNDGTIYQRGQAKLGESWSTMSRGVRRVMGGR